MFRTPRAGFSPSRIQRTERTRELLVPQFFIIMMNRRIGERSSEQMRGFRLPDPYLVGDRRVLDGQPYGRAVSVHLRCVLIRVLEREVEGSRDYISYQFHISKNSVGKSSNSSSEVVLNEAVVDAVIASQETFIDRSLDAMILKKSESCEKPRSRPAASFTCAKFFWVSSRINETSRLSRTMPRSHSGCSHVESRQRPMRQRVI